MSALCICTCTRHNICDKASRISLPSAHLPLWPHFAPIHSFNNGYGDHASSRILQLEPASREHGCRLTVLLVPLHPLLSLPQTLIHRSYWPAFMDLAQTLVRSVARAFYDTRHILVIDALMIHSAYAHRASQSPLRDKPRLTSAVDSQMRTWRCCWACSRRTCGSCAGSCGRTSCSQCEGAPAPSPSLLPQHVPRADG